MLLELHAKINASISYKTQETHFKPLFVQKPQRKIFPKKSFESILSLYAAETSCKKIRKVPCIGF